jgi:hypothetical protein
MSMPADKPKLPGVEILSAALQVHTTVVQKHIDAVNEVWSQVSCKDATLSSFTSGFSTLLNTWTENTKDLWNFYSGKLHASPASGCPDLVFLLDTNADSSGISQCVAVPPTLDVTKITATPLLTAAGDRLDIASHVTWVADSPGVLKISISGLHSVPLPRKTGTYSAVVYEATSAPPARALASVRLTFLV